MVPGESEWAWDDDGSRTSFSFSPQLLTNTEHQTELLGDQVNNRLTFLLIYLFYYSNAASPPNKFLKLYINMIVFEKLDFKLR